MKFKEYQELARTTDQNIGKAGSSGLVTPLGLIGEVGTLAAVYKKFLRDGKVYLTFSEHLAEELGDILWYVASLANSLDAEIVEAPTSLLTDKPEKEFPIEALVDLQLVTSNLFRITINSVVCGTTKLSLELSKTVNLVGTIAQSIDRNLSSIMEENLEKTKRRWGPEPERKAHTKAPCFDKHLFQEEQLPRVIEVSFIERTSRQKTTVFMKVNDLIVGDPLTDNARYPDGYRFHDAFHWAYATVLGWSPVIRALLKCKRKSEAKLDEIEDGARATIIEECISFQVFNYARENSLLVGLKHLDHDLLKLIKSLTKNLEVERCAEWEWEKAIIDGYAAFRSLNQHKGGTLVLNADERSISFRTH